MATAKQRAAARRNIKKAQQAAKRKRTIAHLPKKTRTALGKEGAKAAKRGGSNTPLTGSVGSCFPVDRRLPGTF